MLFPYCVCVCARARSRALSLLSHVQLCDHLDYSRPGSSVHEIL